MQNICRYDIISYNMKGDNRTTRKKKQRKSALNGTSFIVSIVSHWSDGQACKQVLMIVDDTQAHAAQAYPSKVTKYLFSNR
jgi:hypothetical protein